MLTIIRDLIVIAFLTVLPFLELRASIPYGIILGYPWWVVLVMCLIFNIIIAPLTYLFWNKLIHLLRWIKFIDKLYNRTIERVQRKSRKYVEKYGELGLALFIGIPLPGSGVWSGSLAANIFGLRFRKYMVASIIGVLIAGMIVTIIMVSGTEVFSLFVKIG